MRTALVGREVELEAIGHLLARPNVGALVLAGPPGVGKTSLAAAAADLAAAAGFATERVTATRGAAAIPFGAVAQLLPAGGALERADLLRRAVAAVAERAGARPLLLLVDDAHLLDDASATLVLQLVLSGSAFVLVTMRTGEPAPDPVLALWKDGLASRVEIAALGLDDTAALLTRLLEGPLLPGVAEQLHTATAGNPLFLHQVVEAARRHGVLVRSGGMWLVDGALPLSESLVAAIEDRLGALDGEDRELLELVAYGEPLTASMLEEVAGDGGADRLERLEARGLLRAEPADGDLEVRVAHPLYAEVLRAQAPGSFRRRAASRLVATGGSVDVLRKASWALDAGGAIDPDLAVEASLEARRRFDLDLALRLARAAVDAGGGFEARYELANVHGKRGESAEALALLRAIEGEADSDDERGRVAATLFDVLAYLEQRPIDAFAVVTAAAKRIEDPPWQAELAGRGAYVASLGGFLDLARTFIEAHDAEGLGRRARVWLGVAGAVTESSAGCFDRALAAVRSGRDAVLETRWFPSLPERGVFDLAEITSLALAGRLDDAAAAVDRARAEARHWSRESWGFAVWGASVTDLLRGRLDDAAEAAGAAIEELRPSLYAEWVGTHRANVLAAMGDVAGAEAALAATNDGDVFHVDRAWATAWIRFASGDPAGAVAAAAPILAGGEPVGANRVMGLVALCDVARFGAAAEALAVMERVVPTVEGDLAPALLGHARALASGRGDDLAAAADVAAATGLGLLAAEAAVAAAAAYRAEGRNGAAASWSERAAALVEAVPSARTPGLRGGTARLALSRREHEVVSLAVAGLANREIAERLGVSKRTVDSQLQRAYDKLGVRGRADLAAALERDR